MMDGSQESALYRIRDDLLFNLDDHPENIFYFLVSMKRRKTLMKDKGKWGLYTFDQACYKIYDVILDCICIAMTKGNLGLEFTHYKYIYDLIASEVKDIIGSIRKN